MKKFIASTAFKNGDSPHVFSKHYNSLCLVNNGDSDLSFELHTNAYQTETPHFNFTLAPGEVFDETVNPFSSIKVTGSGSYKGFVRLEV